MAPPPSTDFDVKPTDPVRLTQLLTQIESSNPTLSSTGAGTGESAIADYLSAWLTHRGIETHRLETQHGRPSIVGIVRGTGGGKSLMLNGHIDTVSLVGYVADPLSGALEERNGKLVVVGRGALDMKAGLAAGMALLCDVQERRLKGDIILAAIADEEHLSKGTEELLAAGWKADAAVVTEPTGLALGATHKGFLWVEIDVQGIAAHGSMPKMGVDAIGKMGKVLVALDDYAKTLPTDEMLGQSSLHCGLIKGGEEPSTYPAACSLTVEVRTVPAQDSKEVLGDIKRLLEGIAKEDPAFKFSEPKISFERKPYRIDSAHELTKLTRAAGEKVLSTETKPQGVFGWCDAALLGEAGIPSVVFGPAGEGLHGNDEWVEVESIRQTADILKEIAKEFCGVSAA